jgi:Sortase domain
MTGPVVPRPGLETPRLPKSVLRRRPAEIVSAPAAPALLQRIPAQRTPPRDDQLQVPDQRMPERIRSGRTMPAGRRAAVRRRRWIPASLISAVLVFVGLFAVGLGLGQATGFDLGDLFRGPDKPPPRAFPVLEPSRPVSLRIPAIKVSAPVMLVGQAADGSVDVPPLARHNEAGWFDEGPTPGQFGPAIIVGHADTRSGPSVFHNLKTLKAGQKIEVVRQDHQIAVFEINSVEHWGKNKLPVERVYGDYQRPQLRLMTCGGTWLGGSQGYEDNYVVFASLVSAKKA